MKYEYRNGKYIVCKDGVYFALTPDQAIEMSELLQDILVDMAHQFHKTKQTQTGAG